MRASRAALVAIAVVVAGAVAVPAARAATAEVGIADFRFSPKYTRIEPGDSVLWTQRGSVHTVTSRTGAPEAFNSGDLVTGQTFTRTFPTAGRYAYHCTIHAEMRAVVQVGPDNTPPTLTRVRGRTGPRMLRVSFRLSERAKVSVELVRRGRVIRKGAARTVDEGPRSAKVRVSGLAPGRYRVRVRAIDVVGNVATARAGSFAVASLP